MYSSKNNLYLICILLIAIGLASCSSAKNMSNNTTRSSSTEEIATLKDGLKFKTHFGAEGEMNVKATNTSNETLDISKLVVILQQMNAKSYKAYSLEELGVSSTILAKDMAVFELSLGERINKDFKGEEGRYNVMMTYDTQKAIDNKDERSIYFITYTYSNK